MFTFFRISAMMMDNRNLEHREGYDVVMKEVSALIPLPFHFGKGKKESWSLKKVFIYDPMYLREDFSGRYCQITYYIGKYF